MAKTKVVNIRGLSSDQREGITMVDRTTLFGNPFKLTEDTEHNRYIVLVKYAAYFANRIIEDEAFRQAVQSLKGKTLGCWCHPRMCHAHIIAAFLNHQA